MESASELQLRHLAEEVGLLAERQGLPRMVGRVLGWLLVCDPPHQSAADLVTALQASKGSISTTMGLMLRLGLVDRISRPGDRRTYYMIKPDMWVRLIRNAVRELTVIREMADRGLALLGCEGERSARLRLVQNLYGYLEREYPKLVDRWQGEYQEAANRKEEG